MVLTIHDLIQSRDMTADARKPRTGKIRLIDSTVHVWEDGVDDAMTARVMDPAVARLRRMGWTVRVDPDTKRNYPSLARGARRGHKGDLEVKITTSGRHLEIVFFQNVANVSNSNGGFYDFDKLDRMPYLLRLLALATMRDLTRFLCARHGYAIEAREPKPGDVRAGRVTADAYIAANYADNWHTDPALGRPRLTNRRDNEAGDGTRIEQGQHVWYTDERGRWQRARAFYDLNNMWWLSANPSHLTKRPCYELRSSPPSDPRVAVDTRQMRRTREQHLTRAVAAMDFGKAEALKRHIFGADPLYRIYSDKQDGWYRSNACGYTNDVTHAGLYRREEAVRLTERADYLRVVPVDAAA